MMESSYCTRTEPSSGTLSPEPARLVEVEVAQPEAAEVPEHLQSDAESLGLRSRAQRRRELLNRVFGRHYFAEDGAIPLAEGDGDCLVPGLLAVEEHVGEKHAHLAHVDLIDERVKGEVHRLHGIHVVREHTLPIGRHVHARVGDRRLHDVEGGDSASRVEDGSDAHERELVALMVEAHGDDPVRAIAFHVEKTARVLR